MHGTFTLIWLLPTIVVAHSAVAGLDRIARDAGKLYFGTATNAIQLTDIPYTTLLNNTHEFGQLTPANNLKWDNTEPTQNNFTFSGGDQIVRHGRGQFVRGHNLVGHTHLPAWVTDGPWTKSNLTEMMVNHVSTIAGRYKGEIYAWDVINEPLNDDGTFRSQVFFDTLGEEYISIALHAARAADPHAKLYINEYDIEAPGPKATGMINLINSLQARGVPIDGIGVQGHMTLGTVPHGIKENLQVYTDLGVEIALTELDVRMTLPATPEMLSQQKADYETLVSACNAVKKCIGVTIWDFTDKYSWVPKSFPGLGAACPRDENLNLKPAYDGIIEGFKKHRK